MKKISLLLASFLLIGTISAQRKCGTMDNLERLKMLDPSLQTRMQQIESETQQAIVSENINRGITAINSIPVVVHVVYNTATQNISDAQIQSQITVLNNDFRRLNADKVNTPSAFASVAADAEITFCLASVSPTGAATNGIVRTSTAVTSFIDDDLVKHASSGGQDAWPSGKYLNLWVCNLGGGLLGYAQFPGGPVSTDGVVIGYKYFGNTGTVSAPYNLGRTATHEVGHWLNLYHIWGDASCGNDLVSDTPVQTAENYGCPSYPKSNSCGTSSEMFMNYMDYTDDGCMNMFSLGQKSRAKALFAPGGARESLLTSAGCGGAVTTTSCGVAVSLSATSITNSTVTLNWGAVSGASNYNVKIKATAGTTWTTANTASTSKGFTGLAPSTSYEFQVQTVCSGGTSAFSASKTFSTAATTVSTTGIITVGAGTSSSPNAPYGTYYMDEKVQFIITQAELTAAGYSSTNNILRSLAFNAYSVSTQAMSAFTIKMRHTTATSFSSTSYLSSTNMITVYSGNYVAQTGWNTHTFTTPFTYNGTGNVLVEICWDNSAYSTDSRVFYTSTSANTCLYTKADIATGGVCTNTTGTLSTSRPNMRFAFSGYSSSFSSKLISENDVEEQDMLTDSDFNLYPNPAGAKINVEYKSNENSEVSISIYNMMGSLIGKYEQGNPGGGKHLFSLDFGSDPRLSDMSDGIYLCAVTIDGVVKTKRFVVSKK